MSSSHSLPAFFTLCVALTWAVAKQTSLAEDDYFDSDKWTFVPSDNDPITSLSELKTGVYYIQLLGKRAGCGLDSNEPGMIPRLLSLTL